MIKGDTAEARRLLDQAKSVVETDESMPGYIHVVAGKIDLQRALIALQHGHVQEVLPGMASALARVYRFAPDEPRYREQVAFEKLIANWLHEYSVAEHVDSFVRTFDVESVMAHGSDLPYVGAQADEWLIAWERSRKFFQSWQRQVVEKAHENPA